RAIASLLGQVHGCGWLALTIGKSIKKDDGIRGLLFFDLHPSDLLRVGFLGGSQLLLFSESLSLGSIPINRGLIQAIPTSLPPQPIGEATKASNLQRIPPGVQGRSHFTYFLYLIVQIRILNHGRSRRRYSHHGTILSIVMRKPGTGHG
ncbi:hypothetical protein Tco_1297024, partial [Tanacetum coccineum]